MKQLDFSGYEPIRTAERQARHDAFWGPLNEARRTIARVACDFFAFACEANLQMATSRRRDAIRRELYNLRWKLNSENDRKYNATGKGRHFAAMCEGRQPSATRPVTPRRQANVTLPRELQHAIPTLQAIMRNGSDRSRSIRELAAERGISFTAARKKYFADRRKLLNFFAP